MLFDVTWSRGTMGFTAASIVTPFTCTADAVILTFMVTVWPASTRTPVFSVGE
jgi:hypothetical protein